MTNDRTDRFASETSVFFQLMQARRGTDLKASIDALDELDMLSRRAESPLVRARAAAEVESAETSRLTPFLEQLKAAKLANDNDGVADALGEIEALSIHGYSPAVRSRAAAALTAA